SGRLSRRVFTVEVRNPGVPSRIELARIETFIRSAPRIRNESDAEQLPAGEGGGMGLRLIAMTLQGMGLRPSQFQMLVEDEHTVARIHFPLGVLYKETVREKAAEHNIGLLPSDSARDMYLNVARAIDLSMLRFDVDGNLLQTTENFLDRHKLGGEQRERIGDLLPAAFYENLFVGPDRVAQSGVVHNYRVTVPTADRSHFILYNVNGCMTDNRFVDTTWQMVTRVENRRQLSEGFLDSNVLVSQIIRPYIHPQALEKAREIARKGDVHLPDEVKEATIFFSDLVDFTRHSESLSPEEVISLLNIAIGICVRSIDKNHGNVDKFLGDGIMAIFPDPLEAVVAAFEIQQQFSQLKEFRELQEQPSIRARTGIHTGSVVIGSVGT
ncbi:MAG: adenylate/guanylate cyclase domain-containing protein, partial [Leptospiraceae bacterium]|nr:adenylate/guanylate cyclase domain-containing protein [Leptospiraceae bacterium]